MALLRRAGGSPCHPGTGKGLCSDRPDRPFGVSDWSPVCIALWGSPATAPGSEHPNKAVWRPDCSCLSLLTAFCPLLTWSCASLLCVLGLPQTAKGCRSSQLGHGCGRCPGTLLHRVGEASTAGTPGTAGTQLPKIPEVLAQDRALPAMLGLVRAGAGRAPPGAPSSPHLPAARISSKPAFPPLLQRALAQPGGDRGLSPSLGYREERGGSKDQSPRTWQRWVGVASGVGTPARHPFLPCRVPLRRKVERPSSAPQMETPPNLPAGPCPSVGTASTHLVPARSQTSSWVEHGCPRVTPGHRRSPRTPGRQPALPAAQ